MSKTYKITTIGGDGIGPEVLNSAIRLLESIPNIHFEFLEAEAGFSAYEKHGTPLPDNTISTIENTDAVLFGAVTTPPNIDGYFSPIVRMRKHFGLYANVRPCFSIPHPSSKENIDIVIIRENTEDLYAGEEELIEGGAVTKRIITREASEKIIRYGFEYARKFGRKKITLVHKSNVMRLTDGLFLEIGYEVAKDFPDIEMEDALVDSCAMRLVKEPEKFDMIVTTNMFGDILSDLCAAHVGGLGVVASANVGSKYGLFEPVHGSAPKYTGQNKVNPSAMLFATSMMLNYLGENELGSKLRQSVIDVIESDQTTYDLGGDLSMSEFTDLVIQKFNS
jgi:isopropylmalate/isohomocitrate dehydrogenase-like protein